MSCSRDVLVAHRISVGAWIASFEAPYCARATFTFPRFLQCALERCCKHLEQVALPKVTDMHSTKGAKFNGNATKEACSRCTSTLHPLLSALVHLLQMMKQENACFALGYSRVDWEGGNIFYFPHRANSTKHRVGPNPCKSVSKITRQTNRMF